MEPLLGLEFKDFQSLKKTSIKFSPFLNLVVGPSNLGKSAAIRALKALVYNAPATGLVREGAKEFNVAASFANGQKVELVKGKNKSEYYWNADLYAKSGANEAPEVVQQHWALPTPDGRQLCFASQHEPPFLLAEPASAVAKVLGELTNANLLMEAVSKANKLRTQALNDAKARNREADEAREELLTHVGLTARGKALGAAREAYSDVSVAVDKWRALVRLGEMFTQCVEERAKLAQLTETSVNFGSLITEVDNKAYILTNLIRLRDEHERLNRDLLRNRNQIDKCTTASAQAVVEVEQILEDAGMCPLCKQPTTH